ncbi:16759_t:CDS:2, partial [Gigaspora rosea]
EMMHETAQNLRQYLRKGFATNLKVSPIGVDLHSLCISHCLQQAFDNCNLDHPEICKDCDELFTLFSNLKENVDSEFHESLIEYQNQLIYFMAYHDIAGTHVAHLEPNRNQRNSNSALETIAGIQHLHEWSWPNDEAEIGYIYARSLLGIGPWKKFMPANIQKIVKKHVIKKPEPSIATHSHLSKSWTTPMPKIQGHKNLLFGYHG